MCSASLFTAWWMHKESSEKISSTSLTGTSALRSRLSIGEPQVLGLSLPWIRDARTSRSSGRGAGRHEDSCLRNPIWTGSAYARRPAIVEPALKVATGGPPRWTHDRLTHHTDVASVIIVPRALNVASILASDRGPSSKGFTSAAKSAGCLPMSCSLANRTASSGHCL